MIYSVFSCSLFIKCGLSNRAAAPIATACANRRCIRRHTGRPKDRMPQTLKGLIAEN
jgi:hypothetical protein